MAALIANWPMVSTASMRVITENNLATALQDEASGDVLATMGHVSAASEQHAAGARAAAQAVAELEQLADRLRASVAAFRVG